MKHAGMHSLGMIVIRPVVKDRVRHKQPSAVSLQPSAAHRFLG
jgi:hypothetical protein